VLFPVDRKVVKSIAKVFIGENGAEFIPQRQIRIAFGKGGKGERSERLRSS